MYDTKNFLGSVFLSLCFCGYVIAADPAVVAQTIADIANCAGGAASVDAAKAAVDGASQADPALAALIDQYKEVLGVVGTIGALSSIAKDTGRAAGAIKSYVKPSDKEALHDLRVAEAYVYVLARKNFRECLVKNARGKRNEAGLPEACEEAARFFALVGGSAEIDAMTEVFNRVQDRYAD